MARSGTKLDLALFTKEDFTTGQSTTGTETLQKKLALTFPNATLAWESRATFKANGAQVTWAAGAGTAATSTAAAGTRQVETLTAAGNITATGNITVTVTGAGIAGAPLAVPVAVVNGDAPATWAGKVRTTLLVTAAVTALYDVGGAGTVVTLTRKIEAANDGTLLMAAAAGTATNASLPINSANTTAGVPAAGTVLSGMVNGEVRGTAMPAATEALLVMLVATGPAVNVSLGTTEIQMGGNTFMAFGALAGSELDGAWLAEDIVAVGSGAGTLDLVVFAL